MKRFICLTLMLFISILITQASFAGSCCKARIYGEIGRAGDLTFSATANKKLIIRNKSTNQMFTTKTNAYGEYAITIPIDLSAKFRFRFETNDGCKIEEWSKTISPGDNKEVNRVLQYCK